MSLLYIIIIFVIAFLGDSKVTKNYSFLFKLLLVIAFSIPAIVVGDKTTDHYTYSMTYRYISNLPNIDIDGFFDFFWGKVEDQELGFVYLERMLSLMGVSETGFFVVLAFITNSFFVASFFRADYPLITCLLFLTSLQFFQEPNLVRQLLSISIVFFALRYVIEKDWKHYLFFLVLAFMIHHSSILCIMFLPLCFNIDIHKYLNWGLFAFWSFSLLVALGIKEFDLSTIDILIGISDDYDAYLSSSDRVGVGSIKIDYIYNIILIISFIFYKNRPESNVYYYFLVIGGILANLSVAMPNIYRLGLYFSIACSVILPSIMNTAMDNKKIKVPMQFLTAILAIYYLRFYFVNSSFYFD